ncbi:hypothetical protein [Streptomyces sp. NBC_00696]|uniref:hypothetical protein n=1 Tax=Streptomyces sp. NBC_00696 TaxID=2903672 RepID=UPI002E3340A2|nr:hypothetical protein [Streptomyces sp. NBC_00696]
MPSQLRRSTARAHQLITEGERLLPTARDKTKGVFLAYRAARYLDQKQPETAAAAATQSLLMARRIGGPRCVSLVNDLLPRFKPYARADGVPKILQLAAAGRSTGSDGGRVHVPGIPVQAITFRASFEAVV